MGRDTSIGAAMREEAQAAVEWWEPTRCPRPGAPGFT